MAETCDVSDCDQRAAYIVEPGFWLCREHALIPSHDPKEADR